MTEKGQKESERERTDKRQAEREIESGRRNERERKRVDK